MKKEYLIFTILVGIILILSTSAIYAGKTINLGNITMEVPNELQNGENVNFSGGSYIYRNISNGMNMFNIYLYSDYTSSYVKLVGFWISKSSSEDLTVAGHPAILVKDSNSARGNFTYLFFESDGNIVMINLPHSNNVTSAAENMVASTPPAIYSETEFYNLMDQTRTDYENYREMQELIDASYENGYYGGYADGVPKGIFSRLFWRIGL